MEYKYEIRFIDLVKSGNKFDKLNKHNTEYHFAVQSNPIDTSQKIFFMNTVTNWVYEEGVSISYGCMIFFFPTAYGIINPKIEDFKTFADEGILLINRDLESRIFGTQLPEYLQLEPFNEERDMPLLKSAMMSWSALN